MGNIQLNSQLFTLSTHKWMLVQGSTKLMADSQTGIIAQFSPVSIDSKLSAHSYQFRATHHNYFVNILAVLKSGGENLCFDFSRSFEYLSPQYCVLVLIENIPLRLPDIGAIKYEEGLYILYQCLKGLQLFTKQFGQKLTRFQQQMIGINQKGQCKLWINQNYFKGVPNQGHFMTSSQVVVKLFELIENRMKISMDEIEHKEYAMIKYSYLGADTAKICFQSSLQFITALMSINNLDVNKVRLSVPEEFVSCLSETKSKNRRSRNKISLKNKVESKNAFRNQIMNPESKQKQPKLDDKSRNKIKIKSSQTSTMKDSLIQSSRSPTKNSRCTMATENQYKINLKFGHRQAPTQNNRILF